VTEEKWMHIPEADHGKPVPRERDKHTQYMCFCTKHRA
jgi:hypothetical protein